MELGEFNDAFITAKERIRREGADAVGPAEEALRALLPELESEEHRRVATSLISRLPKFAEPLPPPSDLMKEAVAIEHAAYSTAGTDEERIAAMAEARRKIWEIADRAPADEASSIRRLTLVLEHTENYLRDPDWLNDPTDPADPGDPANH